MKDLTHEFAADTAAADAAADTAAAAAALLTNRKGVAADKGSVSAITTLAMSEMLNDAGAQCQQWQTSYSTHGVSKC